MIATIDSDEQIIIEHKGQLMAFLESGCKPMAYFKIGVEQERFVLQNTDFSPAHYDGPIPGIKTLLNRLQNFGWQPINEQGQPIALYRGEASITIEPGGQIELSGAPQANVHDILKETQAYNADLHEAGTRLGLCYLALGHQPKYAQNEIPWMPKQRYHTMRAHMPLQGSLGLDMMQSTCAMHINMDFSSEADMVKKFQVALALQPLVSTLFANSPFVHGKPSGYSSYRGHIWQHTDDDRCGNPSFVFEAGMGFERYTDYILDVPMYFVIRDGVYIDARGFSFRDFLAGKLPVLPGEQPLLSDWVTHLSTVFPNVRLKKHLEMRGADSGDSSLRISALSALWAGLLYDTEALDIAWERIIAWTPEEHQALNSGVDRHGFNTPFRDGTVQDFCLWMLSLSRQGLKRRSIKNLQAYDESYYLGPLQAAAEMGRTFAEQLLERYEQEWNQDIDTAIRAMCKETSL